MSFTFSQYSETDKLKKVIIGCWEGYAKDDDYIEIVNEAQKEGLPDAERLKLEFDQFKKTLEAYDVEVLVPDYVGPFVYDQLTPRDIGITIGDRFLLCNMVKSSRRYEAAGIIRYLNHMKGTSPAIIIPSEPDILIEGGDVLVDEEKIFVGISQRTNKKGFEYLKQIFGKEFELIPLQCAALEKGENVLHLDCTLNRLGKNHILIYPNGFEHIPDVLKDYEWIEVNAEEQAHLGTNVLAIDKQTIISRDHPKLKELNNRIRKQGFNIIEIPFDGAPATGGSFRCCSLPLVRESA